MADVDRRAGWAEGWLRFCVVVGLISSLSACVRFGFFGADDDVNDASKSAEVTDGDGNLLPTDGGPSADVASLVDAPDQQIDSQTPWDARSDEGAAADLVTDGPQRDQTSADVFVDSLPHDGPAADVLSLDGGGAVPGNWVTIVAGVFSMGSSTLDECRSTTETEHQVTLTRDFEMQTTEVTQAQFTALMGYNPASFTSCGLDCPVEMVSWHEAAAYCNALSGRAHLGSCYDCSGSGTSVACNVAGGYEGGQFFTCRGYRLPSEAEWERAYRAGTTTAYYAGDSDAKTCVKCSPLDVVADAIGWYCGNARSTTHPVAQKLANAWGLYDMAGNVLEWCHDYYVYALDTAPVTDPLSLIVDSAHMIRGGAYYSLPWELRAATRGGYGESMRRNHCGFRCVRTK